MKKRMRLYALAGLMLYGLLLALLVWAEKGAPEAAIRSFWDALWYSLVTLTTVGYGDVYPVSPLGRAIGLIFLLLSVGLLASALGAAASLLRGKVFPRLQAELLRGRRCYVFSEANAASAALAEDLLRREPRSAAVFCRCGKSETAPLPARRALRYPRDIEAFARVMGGENALFLMGESAAENCALAAALRDARATLYCRAPEIADLPEAHFFEDAACAARAYWHNHPLNAEENTLVLVGDGRLARALLDQSILTNCRLPFQSTAVHLFGGWREYQLCHPALSQAFTDEETPNRDALIFHDCPWQQEAALLGRAHRVVFCGDSPEKNAEEIGLLLRYFPVSGQIYGAAPGLPAPAISFGGPREVCTAEIVMRSALDAQARALHALYCRRTGASETWESLSPFLKASNRAAADHLLTKLRLLLPEQDIREITPQARREAAARWETLTDKEPCRRNEHERWLRLYTLYNWRQGPEKDARARTHPCIVPYEALSQAEREKDDTAWQYIGLLNEEGGTSA